MYSKLYHINREYHSFHYNITNEAPYTTTKNLFKSVYWHCNILYTLYSLAYIHMTIHSCCIHINVHCIVFTGSEQFKAQLKSYFVFYPIRIEQQSTWNIMRVCDTNWKCVFHLCWKCSMVLVKALTLTCISPFSNWRNTSTFLFVCKMCVCTRQPIIMWRSIMPMCVVIKCNKNWNFFLIQAEALMFVYGIYQRNNREKTETTNHIQWPIIIEQ